jgi:hypothetical protein
MKPEVEVEVEVESGGDSVSQRLFDDVMTSYPELGPHAEVMAAVISDLTRAVYLEAKAWVTSNLVEDLKENWERRAAATDYATEYAEAFRKVTSDTMTFIAAFRTNDQEDPEDPEDTSIGPPRGNA